MRLHLLMAGIFSVGLFIGTLPTAEAAKMTVQVVDKDSKPVQGATVDVTSEGKKETATTDAKGECAIDPSGAKCDIDAQKGDCKERQSPVGVLENAKIVITLHCWPPK